MFYTLARKEAERLKIMGREL